MRAILPIAHIRFERRIGLHGRTVRIREKIESLLAFDRAIGWTQHVTLGPPFLENGVTEFRASATQSQVLERPFGTADYLSVGASFTWPMAPRAGGGEVDLRRFPGAPTSSAYTAHLMDASVAGYLGRESQPRESAVERADHRPRDRVRRVADARIPP